MKYLVYIIYLFWNIGMFAYDLPGLRYTKPDIINEVKPHIERANLEENEVAWKESMETAKTKLFENWNQDLEGEIQQILSSIPSTETGMETEIYTSEILNFLKIQKEALLKQWNSEMEQYILGEFSNFLNLHTGGEEEKGESYDQEVLSIDDSIAKEMQPDTVTEEYYLGKDYWEKNAAELLERRKKWEDESLQTIQKGMEEWNRLIGDLETEKEKQETGIEERINYWKNYKLNLELLLKKNREDLQAYLVNTRSEMNQMLSTVDTNEAIVDKEAFKQSIGNYLQLQESLNTALASGASLEELSLQISKYYDTKKLEASNKAEYWKAEKSITGKIHEETVNFNTDLGYSKIYCETLRREGFEDACPFGTVDSPTYKAMSMTEDGTMLGWHMDASTKELYLGTRYYYNTDSYKIPIYGYYTEVNNGFSEEIHGPVYDVRFDNTGFDMIKYQENIRILGIIRKTGTQDLSRFLNGNIRIDSQSSQLKAKDPGSGEWRYFTEAGTHSSEFKYYGEKITMDWQIPVSTANVRNDLIIETNYSYTDRNAEANETFWNNLSQKYSSYAENFRNLSIALSGIEKKVSDFLNIYDSSLESLTNYKAEIAESMNKEIAAQVKERDIWIEEVYGYTLDDFTNSVGENVNSEYRLGQKEWEDAFRAYRRRELTWLEEAAKELDKKVYGPNESETSLLSKIETSTKSMKEDILESEERVEDLKQYAETQRDSFYFKSAKELIEEAELLKEQELISNQKAMHLSEEALNSSIRAENYLLAEKDSLVLASLIKSEFGEEASVVEPDIERFQTEQVYWKNEIEGADGGFAYKKRIRLAELELPVLKQNSLDLQKAENLQAQMIEKEKKSFLALNEKYKKAESYYSSYESEKANAELENAEYYYHLSIRTREEARESFYKEYKENLKDAETSFNESKLIYSYSAMENYLKRKKSLLEYDYAILIAQVKEDAFKQESDLNSEIKDILSKSRINRTRQQENLQDLGALLELAKRLSTSSIPEIMNWKEEALQLSYKGPMNLNPKRLDVSNLSYLEAEYRKGILHYNELEKHSFLTEEEVQSINSLFAGMSESLNSAGNESIRNYTNSIMEKLISKAKNLGSGLQDKLIKELNSDVKYKYLRDKGYEFQKVSSDIIRIGKNIKNGELNAYGYAMEENTYGPQYTYLQFTIQTEYRVPAFSLGNADSIFREEFKALELQGSLESIQEYYNSVESEIALFFDKAKEIEDAYKAEELNIQTLEDNYISLKDSYVENYQGLEPAYRTSYDASISDFKKSMESMEYTFSGKQGKRVLKGKANVPTPIGVLPMDIVYGEQTLELPSDFTLADLKRSYELSGQGSSYVANTIQESNDDFSKYLREKINALQKVYEANERDKEEKGFLFDVLSGAAGSSGSVKKAIQTSLKNEVQSRVSAQIAKDSGLPTEFVSALMGGKKPQEAARSYVESKAKTELAKALNLPPELMMSYLEKNGVVKKKDPLRQYTNAGSALLVSGAAGLVLGPSAALLPLAVEVLNSTASKSLGKNNPLTKGVNSYSNFMDRTVRNDVSDFLYKNDQIIDTTVTVGAHVTTAMAYGTAAVGTAFAWTGVGAGIAAGGVSLGMAVSSGYAAYKAARGAVFGGTKGALAGVLTAGATVSQVVGVTYDVSYTYDGGFAGGLGLSLPGTGSFLSAGVRFGEGRKASYRLGAEYGGLNLGLNMDGQQIQSASLSYGTRVSDVKMNLGYNWSATNGNGLGLSLGNENVKIGIDHSEYGGTDFSLDGSLKLNPLLTTNAGISWNTKGKWGVDASIEYKEQRKRGEYSDILSNGEFGIHYDGRNISANLDLAGTNAFRYENGTVIGNTNFAQEFGNAYFKKRTLEQMEVEREIKEEEERRQEEERRKESRRNFLNSLGIVEEKDEDETDTEEDKLEEEKRTLSIVYIKTTTEEAEDYIQDLEKSGKYTAEEIADLKNSLKTAQKSWSDKDKRTEMLEATKNLDPQKLYEMGMGDEEIEHLYSSLVTAEGRKSNREYSELSDKTAEAAREKKREAERKYKETVEPLLKLMGSDYETEMAVAEKMRQARETGLTDIFSEEELMQIFRESSGSQKLKQNRMYDSYEGMKLIAETDANQKKGGGEHEVVKDIAKEIKEGVFTTGNKELDKKIKDNAAKDNIANTLCWANQIIFASNKARRDMGQETLSMKDAYKLLLTKGGIEANKMTSVLYDKAYEVLAPSGYETNIVREQKDFEEFVKNSPDNSYFHVRTTYGDSFTGAGHSTGIYKSGNELRRVDTMQYTTVPDFDEKWEKRKVTMIERVYYQKTN